MQVFFSCEATPYFDWQVDLLLASAKKAGWASELVMGVAAGSQMPKNSHRMRHFIHENYGKKFNYLPINKPMALCHALQEKFLKPPFVVVDADFLFMEPWRLTGESITYQEQPYSMGRPHIAEKGFLPAIERFGDSWVSGGCVYFYPEFEDDWAKRFAETTLQILQDGVNRGAYWWCVEMLPWIITVLDAGRSIDTRPDWEILLHENKPGAFVHYHSGLSQVFNKHEMKNLPPNEVLKLAAGLPCVNSSVALLAECAGRVLADA